MAELRTGRCRTCSRKPRQVRGKRQPGVAVVYRWKSGKGRELYRAHCWRCGDDLQQTTYTQLKHVIVREGDPEFRKLSYETAIGKHDCYFMPAASGHSRCIYCRKFEEVA